MDFPKNVIEQLAAAKRVAVLTGAGISAESGVATFRGKDGIWNKLKPEELASMDAFLKNPSMVLEWYDYRRKLIIDVKPNNAHTTLAEMEARYPYFAISTQNIDGLHRKAGSQNVFELHGNILRNRCNECGAIIDDVEFAKGSPLPRCTCNGIVRPDVVWFGEMLPVEILETSYEKAAQADVYLSVGTSAVVYPAAQLPMAAKQNGAFVIEINLEPTPLSPYVDASFFGKAGDVLPQLWRQVKERLDA